MIQYAIRMYSLRVIQRCPWPLSIAYHFLRNDFFEFINMHIYIYIYIMVHLIRLGLAVMALFEFFESVQRFQKYIGFSIFATLKNLFTPKLGAKTKYSFLLVTPEPFIGSRWFKDQN